MCTTFSAGRCRALQGSHAPSSSCGRKGGEEEEGEEEEREEVGEREENIEGGGVGSVLVKATRLPSPPPPIDPAI